MATGAAALSSSQPTQAKTQSSKTHECITERDVVNYCLGQADQNTLLSIESRVRNHSCCREIALRSQWACAYPQPLSAFTSPAEA
jgi:hypothetical protein